MTGAVSVRTTNLGLGVINFAFPNWGDDMNNNLQVLDVAMGVLGLSLAGTWENATAVTVGELYVDTDTSEVYRVLVGHTTESTGTFAEDRTANPTYWDLVEINYSVRGAWTTATAYSLADIAYDEAQHLIVACVVPHTSDTTIRADLVAGNWVAIVDMKSTIDAVEQSATDAAASAEIASGIVSGEIGPAIAGSPAKTALVDADNFAITNSEDSSNLGRTTYGNLKTVLSAYIGTSFAAASHTHVLADITDYAAAHALKADLAAPTFTGTMGVASATFTGTLTLGADPTNALHAATKQYVDGLLVGVSKRGTVRVATTANITIATALNESDTIDGVSLSLNDLVLVKDQTAAEDNGVYVVGVTPVRDDQFDTYDEFPGSLIAIQEGSTNADDIYLCTSNEGGTLDTTSLTFSKFNISGALLATNNLSDINDVGTARSNLVIGETDAVRFGSLNIGHASDTTVTRVSAGVIAVEGVNLAGVSLTQTLTNKTLTTPILNTPTINTPILNAPKVTTPSSANWTGTEALDPANGDIQDITLTGNVTTLTDNMADGESVVLQINDGTAYAITWPTITWVSDDASAPTLQTTVDTIITVWKNNTTLFGCTANGA